MPVSFSWPDCQIPDTVVTIALACARPTNVTVNNLEADDLRWDVRIMYAHAWTRFRLGVGVIHTRSMLDNRDPDDPADDDREPPPTPVFPVVDLWWTF